VNLTSLFEKCAQQYGTTPALTDLATGETLDFRELRLSLMHVAEKLHKVGIKSGERVALLGLNEIDYLICDYGVMTSSRVRVPLDPTLNCEEQVSQIKDAEARALLFTPNFLERASQIANLVHEILLIPMAEARTTVVGADTPHYPDAKTLASLSYTGGTTGSPKAVMATHGSLTSAVQNIVGARGIGRGDVMLNIRPLWPIAAIVVLAHLAAGGTVLLAGKFEPLLFLNLLESHQVTSTSLVPTHLTRIMNETDPRTFDLSMLRAIDVGAAAIGPELFSRVLDVFGARVGIIYGLTEAPWSCYQSPSVLAGSKDAQSRHMKTVGRGLFGTELVIRSPDGYPVPSGEEGEITIRGLHVTQGYWRRPDADAASFRDGWFCTGDLGSISEDGFLSITGRIKEMLIIAGENVFPREIEEVLNRHPSVKASAVIGAADESRGETALAFVELNEGFTFDEAALRAHCREHLAQFKVPRAIRARRELPRNATGKIMRRLLTSETPGDL
jgi:acyl-CoA synthetase (AMP-forming)/AMP-acid ligase II